MWTEELNQSGHHKKGRGITFCAFYIQHIEPMSEYRTENGGSFGTLWEISLNCGRRVANNQAACLFLGNKKPRSSSGVSWIGCLAVSYSRMANATLPSAL
ncbi:hypothetical protein, partial [Aeromonas allosaccharophila]|uniref:hypothetical protein n=2 Tax=Aeromonas TaxID=642 RepID=UPI0030057FB3